jgi:hypothetical protein
MSISSTIHQER